MTRIVLVDDDKEFAEDIAGILHERGYEVTTLDDTADALRHVTADKPDLLILDVMFPDNPMAGLELARRVRRSTKTRDLPIILLTGVNQEMSAALSTDSIDPDWMPVQDFVEKPVNGEVLVRKIVDLLARAGRNA